VHSRARQGIVEYHIPPFTEKEMTQIWNKHGGILLNDRESVRAQRGMAFDYLRQFGRNFFTGKSVMNISMSVRENVFDKRSQCEVLAAQLWPYGRGSGETDLLDLASADVDPRERMRHCTCYAVSRLYETVKCQRKPFNPIMGETYETQSVSPSGGLCSIAAEHIVNHPPTTLLNIRTKNWSIFAAAYFTVDMHLSRADLVRGGVNRITFPKGEPRVVEFELPLFVEHGIVMGTRWGYYKGGFSIYGRDRETELVFAPGEPPACKPGAPFSYRVEVSFTPLKRGFFGSAKSCVSDFAGALLEATEGGEREVEKLSGNWLKHCKFGDRVYWRLEPGRARGPPAASGGPEGTSVLSIESVTTQGTEKTTTSLLLEGDDLQPDLQPDRGLIGEGRERFENVSLQSSSAMTANLPSAAGVSSASAGTGGLAEPAESGEVVERQETPHPSEVKQGKMREKAEKPEKPGKSGKAGKAGRAAKAEPPEALSRPLMFEGVDPELPGVLPSDCRRRGDIRAFRAGDCTSANEIKAGLEERQRRDRALRKRK